MEITSTIFKFLEDFKVISYFRYSISNIEYILDNSLIQKICDIIAPTLHFKINTPYFPSNMVWPTYNSIITLDNRSIFGEYILSSVYLLTVSPLLTEDDINIILEDNCDNDKLFGPLVSRSMIVDLVTLNKNISDSYKLLINLQ